MLLLGSIRQCSGNVELKAYTEPRFPIIMVPLNSEFVDLGNTAAAQEAAPAEIFARAYDQCNFAGNMVAEITSNDGGLADTSMLPIRSIRVTSGYGVHVFDAMMFEGAAIATVTADDEAAGACFDGVVASVETFMPLLRNDGPIIAQAKIYVVWYGYAIILSG